jgi:hypothetical protein
MKKIVSISIVLLLLSAATFAQRRTGENIRRHYVRQGLSNGQITRGERFELRKDVLRYKAAERHIRRDGKITPLERRRLHKMKQHTRRDAFRFKHNRRHRII